MLNKQAIDFSFAQGLDTKTDPKRVTMGKFLSLKNTVFNKGGLLQKRNGYSQLTSLPNASSTYVTTFNDNLTAIGTTINAYSDSIQKWIPKGSIQPLNVETLPLLRNNLNQTACDSQVADNGLVCLVYLETNGTTTTNKYVIADSITGQNIVAPTTIPVASGTVSGGMKVFILGSFFIIAFTNTISSVAHLQYISISIANPTLVSTNIDLAAAYIPSSTLSWDGFVALNSLYIAYDNTSGGQSVNVITLNTNFVVSSPSIINGYKSTLTSITADVTTSSPIIYISFYNGSSQITYTTVMDHNLNILINPLQINNSIVYLNLTSSAQNGYCKVFGEIQNAYSWDSNLPTNYIFGITVTPIFNTTQSVFSSGASSISVASATGLTTGLLMVDNTTSSNIAPGTLITVSGTTLTLFHNTAGNSASSPGDTLAFSNVSVPIHIIRSVGLASKSFIINGVIYFLAIYESSYQPTYFLVNGSTSTQESPVICAKIAYENAGGYLTNGLPSVSLNNQTTAQISYLFKDLIQAVNKNTNVTSGTQVAGVYSQTGVNLVSFDIGTEFLDTAEIAHNLNLSGGFLWMYDGYLPVESNFFLWPDTDVNNITAQWTFTDTPVTPTGTFATGSFSVTLSSTSGVGIGMSIADSTNPSYIPTGTIITNLVGSIATISQATTHVGSGDTLSISGNMASKPDSSTHLNAYYYQFTYEWTDNQGNAFRSAPSIPIAINTADNTDTTGSVTLSIPTLRLTYKTANPVKIVIYRWSAGQQIYYQTTSISQPILNDTTIDSITYIDANSDLTILGNNIIYTTGGVLENTNAPASNLLTLFDTRLWLVDSEDQNLLWYSKQVIEATPVEMSDLLTVYIPPTTETEGTTGPISAFCPMDDKLIIFKANAIYYINGNGPDNTGANNQYSQPIFVTSSVGCANQNSIVITPLGLMFQSNKGIWLLGRDLNTNYIGAPVEEFNGSTVEAGELIPGTNQVRFILNTGETLMYDYYYDQWGTFTNVPALSSCIYKNLHTYIDRFGNVFQESIGSYLDGSNPVLISFKTGPLRLGDLQNYQRVYFFYFLGEYYSPHKLAVNIAFDYSPNPSQSLVLSPINHSPPYGSDSSQSPYGQGSSYGGPASLEQFRIFLERQRCMAFSIEVNEVFDPTYGTIAGAGLSLSGINIVMGFKKGYRPQDVQTSAG